MVRSLKARILMLMACFTLALSFTVPAATTVVWAGDEDDVVVRKYEADDYYSVDGIQKIYNACNDSERKAMEDYLKANKSTKGAKLVNLGQKTYQVSQQTIKNAVDTACNSLNAREAAAATAVTGTKEKVNEIGMNFDVSANISGAATTLSGVQQFVSIIVGILAYLVILGMTFFTAIDICYITMPVFREKCEATAQGGGAMSSTNKKTGESKMRFVTDEAMEAVQIGAIGSGKNPLTVYLGKRVLAFILVAIVIYILITGQIDIIVDVALTFVSGIIETLKTLGG